MTPIDHYIKPGCPWAENQRFIITGAPGAGKTTIIAQLESAGESVVYEAARDVIVKELSRGVQEPWLKEGFREKVIKLQEKRQCGEVAIQTNRYFLGRSFFDRSPIDTMSYCLRFNCEPTDILRNAVQNVVTSSYYNKTVFLIKNLGFCSQDTVRCEDQAEAILMEKQLAENYRRLGYDVIAIEPCSIEERVSRILAHIEHLT